MEDDFISDDKLKDIYELSRLYDMYGALLNDHNRVIFEDYVLNNYSLGEIAADQDISRQGVRDSVLRCSKKLRDYEKKLGFLAKLDETDELIGELEGFVESTDGASLINRIRKTRDL